MAIHNIQFKGLRHTPSDITGQDGDLLECVNLIHENGELKPIELPEKTTMKGRYSNETLVAVHNLTDGNKFVYAVWNMSTSIIRVKNENGDEILVHGLPGEEVKWADTIGNTLIIGTTKSVHYALYKNGQYKWLGDKLPQPVFEFDMGNNYDSECSYIQEIEPYPYCTYNNVTANGVIVNRIADVSSGQVSGGYTFLDNGVNTIENKKSIRDNLRAKMASLIKDSKNKGRFLFPFLVRYAVRMFDGNYTMHSAPILMLPSIGTCPILAYLSMKDKIIQTNYSISDLVLEGNSKPLTLQFKGFLNADGGELTSSVDDWGDIIKGVDVFLSSQIVSFNDSYYDDLDNIPTKYYCTKHDIDYGFSYAENTKEDWYGYYTSVNNVHRHIEDEVYDNTWYKNQYFPLQSFSSEYIQGRIEETNLFYRVKKYDLDKLDESWEEKRYLHDEIEYGLLDRLETLPTLPDDYVSRCRIAGGANYNYNQRLILGNIKLQAPRWYQDAKRFGKGIFVDMCFVIEKPEKTIYVRWDSETNNLGNNDFGHYIYYPDPDCKKVIVRVTQFMSQTGRVRVIPMHEHTGLNGAYALMPDLKSLDAATASTDFEVYNNDLPSESSDRYYQHPNTIAMSSVANPFHFDASNFKDIGRAKVIGIAANMLDVSSAQWGQYPIYVFCSDGIIAVMIDGEGKMGGIQAVSADVLREPRGLSQPTLIQTGQALMFLTQRGVMAIAGTKVSCISNDMKGRHYNPMRELAGIDYRVGAFANLITRTCDDVAFDEFASVGFLAYDYAHHRVLLLSIGKDYQYVYSLNSGLWSKQIIYADRASYQIDQIPSNVATPQRDNPILKVKPISAAVNNYTEMYLQDTDGYLYRTMVVQAENSLKQLYQYGYFISRPIRFGTDEYKSLVRTLHRYTHFANVSFVKMAVYGSRDGVKYGRLNTLRGMSYKYFIFAIYTYLMPNERYSYLSVDFETRLNNKLR